MRALISLVIACVSATSGLASIPAQQKPMWAVIDTQGRMIVPFTDQYPTGVPDFPTVRDQKRRDGVAIRSVSNIKGSIFHTENEVTHQLIATFPPLWNLENFEPNGLIRVTRLEFGPGIPFKAYGGFVKPTGEVVVPPNYRALSPLDSPVGDFGTVELAPVQREDKAGFVDGKGSEYFDLNLSAAREFGEGQVAPVKLNGKWGYIDQNFKFVIPPKFDDARPFSGIGLAAASLNGAWGYINHTGNFTIGPGFDQAWAFGPTGLAIVKQESKDQVFVDQDVGIWHIKAVVFAIPSTPRIGPSGIGTIIITGHSADGLVTWTIDTSGQTLNIATKVGDFHRYITQIDDFPKQEPEETIFNLLVDQLDGKGSYSLAVSDESPQKDALLDVQRRNFESSRDSLKQEIMSSRHELLSSLRTMIQTSGEWFGKLHPLDRCLPPSCIY